MNTKTVLLLILLLISSSLVFYLAENVAGSMQQYYDDFTILADGSVSMSYPISPPVTTSDNVTYTLTRNVTLFNWIRVERNNTVLDGANYSLANAQPACPYALGLEEVSNVTARNLNFIDSGGLWLPSTSDCVIIDNNFVNCTHGTCLWIERSTNVTLSRNTIKNASFGDVYGDAINYYLHSIDTSNTVDGKPVYYLMNQKNLEINPSTFSDIGYLAVVNSTNVAVENLTLMNRRTGMLLAFTNDSEITNNIMDNDVFGITAVASSGNLFSGNEFLDNMSPLWFDLYCCNNTITGNMVEGGTGGIGLQQQCNDNKVSNNNVSDSEVGIWLFSFCSRNLSTGNVIENCSGEGFWLLQSQNNTFVENTVLNATRALRLEQVETRNNTFYHNNLENNRQPFLVLGTIGSNIWDNGFEGNYWSDYNGTDNNQDGIGDTPYIIDENNTDHYPLMGAFQSFNVSAWNVGPDAFEEIDLISNVTISSVNVFEWLTSPNQYIQAGQLYLALTPDPQENISTGFCRITLPNDILNTSDYTVLANMTPTSVNRLAVSNDTYTTLYFTLNSSAQDGIIVVPEFSLLVILVFTIATPLALHVRRKRMV